MLIDDKNLNSYKIDYSLYDGSWSFEVRKNVSIIAKLVDEYKIPIQDRKILDYGFGNGNILALFHKKGAFCYGVEILPEAINRLASLKDYELRLLTGDTIPFEKSSFDIIVASQSIEHVPDESLVLREISRVLKPGSFFIMGVPSNGHRYNPLHFREYTRHDIGRLESLLKASCIGYQQFGGAVFLKLYDFINYFAKKSMNAPPQDTLEQRAKRLKKKIPILLKCAKYIYYQIVVRMLIFLYLLSGKFQRDKNNEIWFVFKS